MTDCSETLREMERFLDGELPSGYKDTVQTHLSGCNDCLGAFEFHYELKRMIMHKCRDELPTGLLERVIACFGSSDVGGEADPGEAAG